MAEEIIASDQSSGHKPQEIITNDPEGKKENAIASGPETGKHVELKYKEAITQSTREGGLKQLPETFKSRSVNENKVAWMSVDAKNPFEILYLDYKLARLITPEIVKNNFDLLAAFWLEISKKLQGPNRVNIYGQYGQERIANAGKKLEDAYNKIQTREGIDLYYKELESKRINAGIQEITSLIQRTMEDGELTGKEANLLIAQGIEKDLTENEVRNHLQKLLLEQDFEIRTTPPAPDLFKNTWRKKGMPDPIESTNRVNWLGTEVASLAEMGQVSFNNREAAYTRFRNTTYLPQAVMSLTRNDSQAEVFEKIIEENRDEEIKYLKIVYRLNAELPFRFRGAMYNDIRGLLDNACQDAEGFWNADELFRSGYLQTWIEETDDITALKIKGSPRSTPGFLEFIYQLNDKYPFYLDQLRVNQPEELAASLQQNADLWPAATRNINNQHISTWLSGIGSNHLNEQYNRLLEPVIKTSWYSEQERNMAAVQTLIQALVDKTPVPKISFEQHAVQLLSLEGTGNATKQFSLSLQTPGYTAVTLELRNAPPGVVLSAQKFSLYSLNNQVRADVTLHIDDFKLEKEKMYSFTIVASTPYQQIELPVQVKVVFPTSNFVQKLALYGLASGIFWALAYFIIQSLTGSRYGLSSSQSILYGICKLGCLVIYYKLAKTYLNKELAGKTAHIISNRNIKIIMVLVFFGSPALVYSGISSWFFYWLFPGVLMGTYLACKKYNLNKWLPLIPLAIIVLMAILQVMTLSGGRY